MAAINIERVALTDTFNFQRTQLNLGLDAIQLLSGIVDTETGNLSITGDANLGDTLDDNVFIAGNLFVGNEVVFNGTTRVKLPVGNTMQRPAVPQIGDIRYNNELNQYEGYSAAGWDQIGGGAKGAAGNYVFFENDNIVTGDYTLTTGKNAVTAGPVTIQDGVEITVPTGSAWVVV